MKTSTFLSVCGATCRAHRIPCTASLPCTPKPRPAARNPCTQLRKEFSFVTKHALVPLELRGKTVRQSRINTTTKALVIKEDFVDLETPTGTMRTYRVMPKCSGNFPAVMVFSEIYQVTGPILRICRKIASEGYIVLCPEVYHELATIGHSFTYDDAGTERGNACKLLKPIEAFDSDIRTIIDHSKTLPNFTGKMGAIGFCLGGHLAFRSAMTPEVVASCCVQGTNIHDGELGSNGSDSLSRLSEIQGEMLMVWGNNDNHIPRDGRRLIYEKMSAAGINFSWCELNSAHAMMRDHASKERYDAALTGAVMGLVNELFTRRLLLGLIDDGTTSIGARTQKDLGSFTD